jgi:Icc-related predicted phosphoesterase
MKIAHISDTHFPVRYNWLEMIPECDVLVHTGDMTMQGKSHEYVLQVHSFKRLLESGRCKHIVCIGGNHDFKFREEFMRMCSQTFNPGQVYCLDSSSVEIDGVSFFGFPWFDQLAMWEYYQDESSCNTMVDRILETLPERGNKPKVDILLTHCPSLGILDDYGVDIFTGLPVGGGSGPVKRLVDGLRPFYHLHGHIHEKRGIVPGVTTVMNSCALDGKYNTDKALPPHVFEIWSGKHECRCETPCQVIHVPGLGSGPTCTL